jgi:hypothetical protein
MGCDIHLHIEVKVEGKWEHYGAPNINRNYDLFEKMAGVRGEIENAISIPKGAPDDMNIITKCSYKDWGTDAHSCSWFNLEEIVKLTKWLDSLSLDDPKAFLPFDLEHTILHTYCEGNSFAGILEYPEGKPKWIEDVRFVFWFDN